MRRIVVDWDFKSRIKALFYLNRILKHSPEEIRIRRSNSKGYHVFIWTNRNGSKFRLRSLFGDDKKHLAMDKLHTFARQTAFYKKKRLKGGEVKRTCQRSKLTSSETKGKSGFLIFRLLMERS